jgi:hypothetical protein
MTLQTITVGSLITLGLGALATGVALVHAAGLATLLGGFSLLALSPYPVFGGACLLANRTRGRAIATLVVCALATAGAIYYYYRLIFLAPGSMSGLVFLLVPFYQLPAAILLLMVMFFCRLRRAAASTPNPDMVS